MTTPDTEFPGNILFSIEVLGIDDDAWGRCFVARVAGLADHESSFAALQSDVADSVPEALSSLERRIKNWSDRAGERQLYGLVGLASDSPL